MTQTELAAHFRQLHSQRPLVLPNAWDASSARVIERAGALAIATTSAGVAWALGYPDGNAVPIGKVNVARPTHAEQQHSDEIQPGQAQLGEQKIDEHSH